jgi:hypothetical protein
MTNGAHLPLLIGMMLYGICIPAQAIVIDFEDFPTPGAVNSPNAVIGNYYASQGVLFTTTWYAYNANGLYPPKSGMNSAIGAVFPAEIQFSNPVADVGAYFNNYVPGLTFRAFGASGLLGSVSIAATTQPTPGGPIFYQLPFSGIERATLSGGDAMFYSMDNLTFTVVPEPASCILFWLAVALFSATRAAAKR